MRILLTDVGRLLLPVNVADVKYSYKNFTVSPYVQATAGTNLTAWSYGFSAGMEIMGKGIFGMGAAYKWLFVHPITKSMNKYNIQAIDVYILMSASGF